MAALCVRSILNSLLATLAQAIKNLGQAGILGIVLQLTDRTITFASNR